MSNQINDLKNAIKTAIATCSNKVTSYYPGVSWATKNIFYGSNPLIHNMNRGRQIICHFYRDTTNYLNESDGAAGSLVTEWMIELSAFRKPSNGATKIYDEEGFEDALDDIFSSIIYAIRNTNGLNLSNGQDASIERISLAPHGFVYKTRITINNSWVNSDRT
jgi:hypothetical protein